jgi:hypothetical protein
MIMATGTPRPAANFGFSPRCLMALPWPSPTIGLRKECKLFHRRDWGFGPWPGATRCHKEAALINLVTAAERQVMSSCAKDGARPPCATRPRRVPWWCSHLASFPRRPSAPSNSETARRIRKGKNRRIKLRFSLRASIRFQGLNFIPQARPTEARRCTEALRRASQFAVLCKRWQTVAKPFDVEVRKFE